MDAPIRVLAVDDDPDFAELTATVLERESEHLRVESVTSAADALDRLTETDFDCIVSDYDMPRQNGIEFLETVREEYPDLPFILFTGKGSEEVASDAISSGVTDYLQKESGTDQYTILSNRIDNAVSARQSATEAERSRHRLEQILKTVPACVVQLNREGEFVFANERAMEVLGLERDEVTDRAYNDPDWRIRDLDGDPIPDAELPFRQVLDSGEPLYGYRHTIEWPDGRQKTLLVNGAPLFDGDGSVESVIFSLSDITESRESQERLEQTMARLEVLFKQSPVMINIHDAEGNIINPNPRLCENTGYDETDLTDMKVWDLDRSSEPGEARATWNEMDIDDRREFEGEYRRRDGSTFPVKIHIRRLDLENEDRFVAMSWDISTRKERQRELEVMKRRLEAILANTTTPMFMKNDSGEYIFVNNGYRELFGLQNEDVVGRTDHDIHPPVMADEVQWNDQAVIERDESVETEEQIVVDGETRTFLTSKVPIYDTGERADPNEPIAVFGVASDITELKTRKEELRHERDRLDEFASIVSHDLRNPLNVAGMRLELAMDECESPHLDDVSSALDRMSTLIDDLLTLARGEESADGTEQVSLADLAEETWATVDTTSANFVVETDRVVRASEGRLRQLFENLIWNSVDHGGDEVTVTVGDLEGGFYVEDDGPGIPADEREQVFEAGYSTADGGTGFGLSIVKQVADSHDWSIRVTDSAAGGARFEITGVDIE